MTPEPFEGKLNHLIGLAPFGPTCSLSGILPTAITESDSGLFMTDMDSLNLDLEEARTDCTKDSLWEYLHAARKNALATMETDLLTALESMYQLQLQPFRGLLGEQRAAGYVAGLTEGQTVSVSLTTRSLPGAFLKLYRIGLVVNSNVDVQVSVPGLVTPLTVVCSANTNSFTSLPEPLLLPLDGSTYTFSYVVSGFVPQANKLNCDCGGQQERINQYLIGLVNAPANGLILTLEAGCNGLAAVYATLAANGAAAKVLAAALRFQALALAVERILNSGTIQRFTLMEADQLYAKRNTYKKEYSDRIHWLVTPKGIDIAGCACYSPVAYYPALRKTGILS